MPWEGAAATEMVHLMAEGEIKSCMVVCSNLMVSLPDNTVVQRALDNLDPLVVVDFFMSETAELADVVLPGSVWCEDEGTTTNLEGRVIKINARRRPARRGEARLGDRQRAGAAARDAASTSTTAPRARSGRSCGSPRRAASPTTTASPGRRSTRRAASSGPARREDHPGTPRLFAERFFHPGRQGAHVRPSRTSPPAEEPNDDFPFRLTSGRVVYHYLSGNQTRRIGFLNEQAPEPWVEIHPQAAERLGIEDDDGRARAHAAHRRWSSRRWSCRRSGRTRSSSRSTTAIGRRSTSSPTRRSTPAVKIPEYKACAATIEKLDAPLPAASGRRRGARRILTPRRRTRRMFPYTGERET